MERIKVDHPIFVELRDRVTDPVVLAVLELHVPMIAEVSGGYAQRWECHGCDPGDYAESKADAPCSTFRMIASAHGVEVPS